MRAEALSLWHLLTHKPKNPFCPTCNAAKAFAAPARRRDPDSKVVPERFGDSVLGDNLVLGKDAEVGEAGEKGVLNLLDEATEYRAFEPVASKSAVDNKEAFRRFAGEDKVKSFYSDNSRELQRMAADLELLHPTAVPYRSTSNARIERLIRDGTEGCRSALFQSGFSHSWWPRAGKHFCTASNATPSTSSAVDKRSPYERRFNEPFPGELVPFGALVRYRPNKVMLKKQPRFDATSRRGCFIGWHLQPGGKCKGDNGPCDDNDDE